MASVSALSFSELSFLSRWKVLLFSTLSKSVTKFLPTSLSQLLMGIYVQWPLYQRSLSLNYPFYLVEKFCYFQHFMTIDVLYPIFYVFSLFRFLWQNLFFSHNSVICLFVGQLSPFEISAKEKSNFSTFFPLQLHLSHLRKLCVIFYLGFYSSLTLVVAPWSNSWKSSFSFWTNPLSLTMTYF